MRRAQSLCVRHARAAVLRSTLTIHSGTSLCMAQRVQSNFAGPGTGRGQSRFGRPRGGGGGSSTGTPQTTQQQQPQQRGRQTGGGGQGNEAAAHEGGTARITLVTEREALNRFSRHNSTNDGELNGHTYAAMRDDTIILAELFKYIPQNGAISVKSLYAQLLPSVQEALSEIHGGLKAFLEARKQLFIVRPRPSDQVLFVAANPLARQRYVMRAAQRQTIRELMGLPDETLRGRGRGRGGGRGGGRGFRGRGRGRGQYAGIRGERSGGGSGSSGGRDYGGREAGAAMSPRGLERRYASERGQTYAPRGYRGGGRGGG